MRVHEYHPAAMYPFYAWFPFFGFIWLLCAMSKNKCFAIARQRCIYFYRFEPVILRGYVFLNCNHFRFYKFLQIITLSYIKQTTKEMRLHFRAAHIMVVTSHFRFHLSCLHCDFGIKCQRCLLCNVTFAVNSQIEHFTAQQYGCSFNLAVCWFECDCVIQWFSRVISTDTSFTYSFVFGSFNYRTTFNERITCDCAWHNLQHASDRFHTLTVSTIDVIDVMINPD